jgi:hypothetical protein
MADAHWPGPSRALPRGPRGSPVPGTPSSDSGEEDARFTATAVAAVVQILCIIVAMTNQAEQARAAMAREEEDWKKSSAERKRKAEEWDAEIEKLAERARERRRNMIEQSMTEAEEWHSEELKQAREQEEELMQYMLETSPCHHLLAQHAALLAGPSPEVQRYTPTECIFFQCVIY